MASNYFDESKKYVEILKKEGLVDSAKHLDEIISSSVTSNELLMGVRFSLSKIPLDAISDISRKRIIDYLDELTKLLAP